MKPSNSFNILTKFFNLCYSQHLESESKEPIKPNEKMSLIEEEDLPQLLGMKVKAKVENEGHSLNGKVIEGVLYRSVWGFSEFKITSRQNSQDSGFRNYFFTVLADGSLDGIEWLVLLEEGPTPNENWKPSEREKYYSIKDDEVDWYIWTDNKGANKRLSEGNVYKTKAEALAVLAYKKRESEYCPDTIEGPKVSETVYNELYLDQDALLKLVCDQGPEFVAKAISRLEDSFDIEKDTKGKPWKPWKPEMGERYYYVYEDGHNFDDIWQDHDFDKARLETGNIYKTEEEAKANLEYLKAEKVLRDSSEEFIPVVGDMCFYVVFDPKNKCFGYYNSTNEIEYENNRVFREIFFQDEDTVVASIKNHTNEWYTYFGIEKEEAE